MLEIEPEQEELYGSLAWLLWSKWATWHQSPGAMPDGEGKDLEAIKLLEAGGGVLASSASYWLSAEQVICPLANQLGDRAQQIRARLDLGHATRNPGKLVEARAWYNPVIELELSNPLALKELEKLGPNP